MLFPVITSPDGRRRNRSGRTQEPVSDAVVTATARELAPQAVSDARYIAAANNLRVIAATLDQVGDDLLVKLANVNRTSEGVLWH